MTTNLQINEKSLHQDILNEIDSLLENLRLDDAGERVERIVNEAENIVLRFKKELGERIKHLQENVQWDAFVIAFYGETNAGKSTIIEALRIALSENSKVKQRQAFWQKLELQKKVELALPEIQQRMDSGKEDISKLYVERETCNAEFNEQFQRSELDIIRLRSLIDAKKQNLSFWQRIFPWFSKVAVAEQNALIEAKVQHNVLEKTHALKEKQLTAKIEQAESGYNALAVRQQEMQARHKALGAEIEVLRDGSIVGTGLSDFTRETQEYSIEIDGEMLKLLDAPGIEGKESLVIDNIFSSVKSAHAVFYVTSKAAPPQTGNGQEEGTLEKIRKHLGDQTEVWCIYNKRNTNPQQMLSKDLLSPDECSSLTVLDDKLRDSLGAEHYQGHIALSAKPAFIALAECVPEQSDIAREREKFLAAADCAHWLEKSGFEGFVSKLKHDMANDCATRIHRANANKVVYAIQAAVEGMTQYRQEITSAEVKKFNEELASANRQLKEVGEGFAASLKRVKGEAVQKLTHQVRNTLYERIDKGMDNDEVKPAMESTIKDAQEELQANLEEAIKQCRGRLQEDITKVVEGFGRRVQEFRQALYSLASLKLENKFNLKMEFSSGVDYTALLGTIVGAVVFFVNPAVGLIALSIGTVSLLIGLSKAIWGLFDEDYKKSQQRKNCDESLKKVTEQIDKNIQKAFTEEVAINKKNISEIEGLLKKTVEQAEYIDGVLLNSAGRLEHLSKQISR